MTPRRFLYYCIFCLPGVLLGMTLYHIVKNLGWDSLWECLGILATILALCLTWGLALWLVHPND